MTARMVDSTTFWADEVPEEPLRVTAALEHQDSRVVWLETAAPNAEFQKDVCALLNSMRRSRCKKAEVLSDSVIRLDIGRLRHTRRVIEQACRYYGLKNLHPRVIWVAPYRLPGGIVAGEYEVKAFEAVPIIDQRQYLDQDLVAAASNLKYA